MVDKEIKKLKAEYYKDYPNLKPCNKCFYWRDLGNQTRYVKRDSQKYAMQHRPNYACHYMLFTGEQVGFNIKLYTEHECRCFKEVKRRR